MAQHQDDITRAATEFANSSDADVLVYTGDIGRPHDAKLIDLCSQTKRRKNIAFFLCTRGGDPNAAYRIARCLQENYEKVTIYIGGRCKSAGTLLAVGAHEIVMGDHGQLGPLDIQLGKKDELWETDSGLTVLSSIETLEKKAFDLFEDCLLTLKARSGDRISLKTASDLATNLAIGVVSPIVAQIDPLHVGNVSRAMKIGVEYGKRLTEKSKNAKDGTINHLTNGYPSHDFVIDRNEAGSLFKNVRSPNEEEARLIELLGYGIREPNSETLLFYISDSSEESLDGSSNNAGDSGEGPTETGGGDAALGAPGESEGVQHAIANVQPIYHP